MDTKRAIEILNRRQYVRVTAKLAEAVAELAEAVRKVLEVHDLHSLEVPNVGTLAWSTGRTNCGGYSTIGWSRPDEDTDYDVFDDLTGDGLPGAERYVHGDFNHQNRTAEVDDFILFALHYGEILAALDAAIAERERQVSAAAIAINVAVE